MVAEPNRDSINQFVSLSDGAVSESDAVKWLKKYDNDLNNAVCAFFDNPDALRAQESYNATWDDSAWAQGKEYGPQNRNQNQNLPSFNVHSQDTLNPDALDGRISRPPSRVSNRGASNRQDKHHDLDEQDDDMQKAIAMSMSQTLPGQEVGVTDPSGAHFGPANQSYYETQNWAMTSTRHHAQEILQNPEPEYRKREANTPAFLKPSPAGHYLPALITILHAIPMAREALLMRNYTLPDYGHSAEWWDGLAIQVPKVVDLEQLDQLREWEDLIFEMQRLVAFLDETERAYGSVDVMANMEGISHGDDVEGSFLNAWHEAVLQAQPDFELAGIFESAANVGDEMNKTFHALDLSNPVGEMDSGYSIYDSFDEALWGAFSPSDPDDVYVEKISDVFVIRMNSRDSSAKGHGIKIPSVWYPDRYLKGSIDAVKQMRLEKVAIKDEIRWIEDKQKRIANFQSSARQIDATKLLNVTKSYLQSLPPKAGTEKGVGGIEKDQPVGSEGNSSAYAQVAEELQAVAERVSQKFKVLEQSREQALEKLRELSKLYTKPSVESEYTPKNKYTLRGVSTKHNITYVLERTKPDETTDSLSTEASDWQWWKISFSAGDAKPISYAKVREVEVLKAAKDEYRTTLLVYASEKAVSYESKELPPQLHNFVRADNLSFAAELDKAAPLKAVTPPKRKAEESYTDMNTDTPNWGGYQDSPPKKLNGPSSNSAAEDLLQPPPPYTTSVPPPILPRSSLSRTPATRIPKYSSYDDVIPLSLRATEATVDPSSIALDDVDLNDEESGQEMTERTNGIGVVPRTGNGGSGGYELGSYVPEITMEDADEEETKKTD